MNAVPAPTSRTGQKVNDIILEPIASAEAVLSEEEKEAGVVLVDIGGGTTDVAIFHEGIIRHTAVIPFGGNIKGITSRMIIPETKKTLTEFRIIVFDRFNCLFINS